MEEWGGSEYLCESEIIVSVGVNVDSCHYAMHVYLGDCECTER